MISSDIPSLAPRAEARRSGRRTLPRVVSVDLCVVATSRRLAGAFAVCAVFLIVRGGLHLVTFGLPVSNDDAILLLMGRHLLQGEGATILWNQPYNGALDAYLLAPLLAVLPHHEAYRLYQLACAALLTVLVAGLARRVGGRAAGWAGALLAACGTPYMALMATTGPPPNFLMPLVTGVPLLAGLRALDGDRVSHPRSAALALGFICGLAVWNSSLAIPAFAGMAAGLILAGLRPRPAPAILLLAGATLGAAPLAVARLIGASGSKVVTAASAVTAIRPPWRWGEGALHLGHALLGFLGLQVPLVVDGHERALLGAGLASLLAIGLLVSVVLGVRSRRSLPFVLWGAALLGAFWLSRRTDADDLRYLYGSNAPLLALAGVGLARVWAWRRSAGAIVGLALLVPWAQGDRLLVEHWRDPAHAERIWEVPPIEAPLAALRASAARSVYASLQFAGRITLESRGDIIASQAWNERIPGDPLRFRDAVDLDPSAAWALSARFSRGMPRAGGFRELLRAAGGSWREREAGSLTVFDDFRPPYDEARPVLPSGLALVTTSGVSLGTAALDRDPATAWTSPLGLARGSGVVLHMSPARRLSALVLMLDLERSPLAVPWAVSIEGRIVARGPARAGLQWVNGAPRAGKQALLAVGLGDVVASEVRLVFQGPGPPLSVYEVFAFGPEEDAVPASGLGLAAEAYAAARAGRWQDAVRLYAEAWRREPERASYHACWARARWRAAGRRFLDVESLDDGGPELVEVR